MSIVTTPDSEAHTFSDVLIMPKMSNVKSRRDVDLTTDFGPFKMALPVFSANMKTITGVKMAIAMRENGGMGILHRFCSIEQAVLDFKEVLSYFVTATGLQNFHNNNGMLYGSWSESSGVVGVIEEIQGDVGHGIQVSGTTVNGDVLSPVAYPLSFCGGVQLNLDINPEYSVGVSIGVNENDKKRFDNLYCAGARIFCIDIAHGHCALMKRMMKWIKDQHLKDIYLISGNVATGDGAYDLCDWGANAVKIGVGPGSACLTRKNAGVGVPQLYAIELINEEFSRQGIKNVKKICDGGISTSGDVAKALRGADAVMLGGMLAGTSETPGSVFTNDHGKFYKVYAGSASGENQTSNGGANEFVEGVSKTVEFRGHVKHILRAIKHGVTSAFSYCGATNLDEFQEKCEFIKISHGAKIESKL